MQAEEPATPELLRLPLFDVVRYKFKNVIAKRRITGRLETENVH